MKYRSVSFNFSPPMNAAIYSAYLAYETKNKLNLDFLQKSVLSA